MTVEMIVKALAVDAALFCDFAYAYLGKRLLVNKLFERLRQRCFCNYRICHQFTAFRTDWTYRPIIYIIAKNQRRFNHLKNKKSGKSPLFCKFTVN